MAIKKEVLEKEREKEGKDKVKNEKEKRVKREKEEKEGKEKEKKEREKKREKEKVQKKKEAIKKGKEKEKEKEKVKKEKEREKEKVKKEKEKEKEKKAETELKKNKNANKKVMTKKSINKLPQKGSGWGNQESTVCTSTFHTDLQNILPSGSDSVTYPATGSGFPQILEGIPRPTYSLMDHPISSFGDIPTDVNFPHPMHQFSPGLKLAQA